MIKVLNFSSTRNIPGTVNATARYFTKVCGSSTGVIVDNKDSKIGKAYEKYGKDVYTVDEFNRVMGYLSIKEEEAKAKEAKKEAKEK